MKEYMYLYHNGSTQLSPEQMQKNMQSWMTWLKELGEKGHVKNAGAPLDSAGRVVKGKPGAVTDAPIAESKEAISGYTLVTAADLDQATQLSKGCPIFATGGFVEVRPVVAM